MDGTVLNGVIEQLPDGGSLSLNDPTPGGIAVPGELDEWQFYGLGGRTMGILVNPGSGLPFPAITPQLRWAEVQLVDATNQVLASAASQSEGAVAAINAFVLPASGTSKVRVRASAGHTANSGHYTVSVWDVTADVGSLELNKRINGNIQNSFSTDLWNFSANAGQQIRFDLLASSNPNLVFGLICTLGD